MPDEMKQQKKTQLMKILAEEGVEAVDKTYNRGSIWIPGGDERKPLISKISKIGIEFRFSKDSSALKHKPGWWTDPNKWMVLKE